MACEKSLTCSLKSCTNRDDLTYKSRVEVKAFAPSAQSNFFIKWDDDGQARFHRACWTHVEQDSCAYTNEEESVMIMEAAKTAEYFDSSDIFEKEAKKIADWLKISCHAIAFTGAGISTSAGIGDFRGKGGAWTERDKVKQYGAAARPTSTRARFTYESLRPTYTHEAIAKLAEMGFLKYVISQNVDGLHRLSGVPAAQISELHGNVFHEKCELCCSRFERKHTPRSVRVNSSTSAPPKPCATCGHNHRTGRVCDVKGCVGYLMNTIINFGDSLEEAVIESAVQNAKANDFVLCLGSTLTVTPACNFVQMGNPVRIAICNRQPTPFDQKCLDNGSRVYGDCDDLMRLVMREILGESSVQSWEAMREHRLTQYASERED